MAGVAEPSAVLRVVGVESCCFELASCAWVVVGVDAGGLVAEDADGVASEDRGTEASAMGCAVPPLPGGGALGVYPCLCRPALRCPVLVGAVVLAGVDEKRATGLRAGAGT